MSLGEYHKKRRFDVTAEPRGQEPKTTPKATSKATPKATSKASAKGKPGTAAKRAKKLAFVIQKHRATALHYDLRLEWNGVMLSWAVPRGPSLDPTIKRMAMQVEDHPIEYNKFEGIIPEGEYGGGTVMIWDRGSWTPESPDVDEALAKGDLKIAIHGQKLHGSWVMVRTRSRPGQSRPAWLMIKHRDQWAGTDDIAELAPRSVVSNRLLIEIARDEGGNMRKAADGDPPALLEKILADPSLLTPPKKESKRPRKKAVWHSNRVGS
jgi:bifunctional non-homologous end joining protein LigD